MTYAIVTGSSNGIGKSIAYKLAAEKYNLVLIARSENKLIDIAEDIRNKFGVEVLYSLLDLSEHNSDEKLLEFVQQRNLPVSVLVNNAGYGLSGPLLQNEKRDWINMLDLNVISLTKLTYLFLPILKLQQQSYILNIASTAAYQAVPFLSLYSASKSFVLSFSRGLAQELSGTNVSVTCICPGPTDTNFIVRAKVGDRGQKAANKVNMTPDEVADIAVKAMFRKRKEVVTGVINKLGVFLAWLLPKTLVERTSMKIYQ
ncbi:SDR family oxidoreductase [Pseudopedobacter sp.]|uniref:SDR family NAD(P)-dependent oxidoreductase n=1 Tax=Pseudopedobacter sp. TaxID=1936787 RepID=UPI00333FA58A